MRKISSLKYYQSPDGRGIVLVVERTLQDDFAEGYYMASDNRFFFADIESEEILKHWTPLGYYKNANLWDRLKFCWKILRSK